jgi:acyl dehydratase
MMDPAAFQFHVTLQPTAPAASPNYNLISVLSAPANAGKQYGSLNGDFNPIHLSPLTSRLFGFKRPIAHALYQVALMEAQLDASGG